MLVPWFKATIEACGMDAPLASRTVPTRSPLTACAGAWICITSKLDTTAKNKVLFRLQFSIVPPYPSATEISAIMSQSGLFVNFDSFSLPRTARIGGMSETVLHEGDQAPEIVTIDHKAE